MTRTTLIAAMTVLAFGTGSFDTQAATVAHHKKHVASHKSHASQPDQATYSAQAPAVPTPSKPAADDDRGYSTLSGY